MKINESNSKKGVSLISLVITIIVIIILAAVVIFSAFSTATSSQFAKFTHEFSGFQEEIHQRYLAVKVCSGEDEKKDSAIYAMIAGVAEDEVYELSSVLEGKILSEELIGTNCYKFQGTKIFYSGQLSVYITDEGEIFSMPGYRYSVKGEERRYVNSGKYYIENQISSPEEVPIDENHKVEDENVPTLEEVEEGIIGSGDWALLGRVAKAISEESGDINNISSNCTVLAKDNDNKWKKYTLNVGQEFIVEYGGKEEPVRILGFNHDVLANADAYGEETDLEFAGISFEFVNVTENRGMNLTGTNAGSWENSNLRKYLNEDALENEMGKATKDVIKAVKKPSIKGSNGSWTLEDNDPTIDKMWLLSETEIFNTKMWNAPGKEGTQYAFYNQTNTAHIVKALNGMSNDWWLRSPVCNLGAHFSVVSSWGISTNHWAANSVGVSCCFSI